MDAVDINSNPLARLRMESLWLAAEIQRATGLETIPHITPRDASLMGLQAQLLGAWHAGIKNLLAISGDPSQLGDYPGVHDVYHVDIFELVRSVARMAEGYDCAGNPIGEPPAYCLGVAVNPAADDLDHEVERLRRKADAGAHFAMSQVFFSWEPWERLLDRCGGALPAARARRGVAAALAQARAAPAQRGAGDPRSGGAAGAPRRGRPRRREGRAPSARSRCSPRRRSGPPGSTSSRRSRTPPRCWACSRGSAGRA